MPTHVEDLAKEIVEFEGPIEARRLAKLVASAYDLRRVSEKRVRQLVEAMTGANVRESDFGTFLWPRGAEPSSYEALRADGGEGERTIGEIAPEEMVGGMRVIAVSAHSIERAELVRAIAEAYGVRRVSKGIEATIDAAIDLGVRGGRLADDDGVISAT